MSRRTLLLGWVGVLLLSAGPPAADPLAEARSLARRGETAAALERLRPLRAAATPDVEAERLYQDLRLAADPSARAALVEEYRARAGAPGAGAAGGYLLARILPDDMEALGIVDGILKADPRDRRAWMGKGFRLAALGDHAASRDAYREAWRLDPTRAEACEAWVFEEIARRDMAGARAALAEGLSRLPGNPVLLRTRGLLLEHDAAGAFRAPGFLGEAALLAYGAALAADPDDVEARLARADLEAHLGRLEAARADLAKARIAAPGDGRDRIALAALEERAGRPLEAERALREAIAVPAARDEAGRRLAGRLLAAGRPAEAAELLPAVEREPLLRRLRAAESCRYADPAKAREAVAALLPKEGRPVQYLREARALRELKVEGAGAAASAVLEAGREAHPGDPGIARAAGAAALRAGRLRDAVAAFDAGSPGRDPDLLYDRGLARILGGEWEKAVSDLEACLEIRPEDGAAARWLATAAGACGKGPGALRALEKAGIRSAAHAEAAGRLYLRLGRPEEARAAAQKGLERAADPALWILLARAAKSLGKRPEAEEALRRAEAADPRSALPDVCRAQWALDGGDARGASAAAERADAKEPGSYEILALVAQAREASARPKEAREAVDRALAAFEAGRCPTGPAARRMFSVAAAIYDAAGEKERAEALRRRAEPPGPRDPPAAPPGIEP